ncbi:MAG: diacylglycerol kinase [Armatimonadetes bacterium]|nr:diacylglycerol kinase [Armatimonadota bacterium]
MKLANPFGNFKYAAEGVLHVYRTQKHMRFHFFMLVLVLMVSLMFKQDRGETMVVLLTISLVLIAEMFNTAIEAVVDLVVQSYHPLAKFAKDIAAGAVLMATVNALTIGFILFLGGRPKSSFTTNLGIRNPDVLTVTAVGVLLLFAIVIVQKVSGGKGTFLRGGVVSGHTALGFFFATTIIFVSPNNIARAVAVLLAVLVAQSRVDAGIHTLREVLWGGLLGTGLGMAVYLLRG